MQSTSRNLIDVLKISVIALALTVGVNYLIAWTGAPAGGAPTCPSTHVGCNPPIHSGTADQTKTGGLTVNNLWGSFVGSTGGAWFGTKVGIGPGASATGTAALDVDGTIRVRGGSPGLNKVLTSDATGNATWSTVSASGTSFSTYLVSSAAFDGGRLSSGSSVTVSCNAGDSIMSGGFSGVYEFDPSGDQAWYPKILQSYPIKTSPNGWRCSKDSNSYNYQATCYALCLHIN